MLYMDLLEVKTYKNIMPIGSSRAPIWRPKVASSAVNFTLVRWEGWYQSSGGTPGGAGTSVYEIYIFTNGYIEARFGDWNNSTLMTGGISGVYTSAGVGVAFASVGAFNSMVQNISYVWNGAITNPTIYAEYTYVNSTITSGSATPSLGSTAASWPPAGWTVLQSVSADDAFVTVPITSTTIMGTARTNAYIGSNAYITFGAGSTLFSSLSTTNPALDKFMFNAADRSYLRVAYTTGTK
jgi:hypothetical protein